LRKPFSALCPRVCPKMCPDRPGLWGFRVGAGP